MYERAGVLELAYDNVHDGMPCPSNGHDGDGIDSIVGGPNGSLMTPASRLAISYLISAQAPARSRARLSTEVRESSPSIYTRLEPANFGGSSNRRTSRWSKLTELTSDCPDGHFESSPILRSPSRWPSFDVSPRPEVVSSEPT